MQSTWTSEAVRRASYTDLVAMLGEENRPSGGRDTVREIALNSFVGRHSKAIELGCTNGFTSLELARLVGCRVRGYDVHAPSVANAARRAEQLGLTSASFAIGSASAIPEPDGSQDLVLFGNAMAFMDDDRVALNEGLRVVRPNGMISLVPFYYVQEPPARLIEQVRRIIGTSLAVRFVEEWDRLFSHPRLELYYRCRHPFPDLTDADLSAHCDYLMTKPAVAALDSAVRDALAARWREIMSAFMENNRYAAYDVVLLRRRDDPVEPEFLSRRS